MGLIRIFWCVATHTATDGKRKPCGGHCAQSPVRASATDLLWATKSFVCLLTKFSFCAYRLNYSYASPQKVSLFPTINRTFFDRLDCRSVSPVIRVFPSGRWANLVTIDTVEAHASFRAQMKFLLHCLSASSNLDTIWNRRVPTKLFLSCECL
jgi:hypothetical protein